MFKAQHKDALKMYSNPVSIDQRERYSLCDIGPLTS